jgi:hypothetical protein
MTPQRKKKLKHAIDAYYEAMDGHFRFDETAEI